MEPAALRKLLRDDLDWIVMKAWRRTAHGATDGPQPGPGHRTAPEQRTGPGPSPERSVSTQEVCPQAPRIDCCHGHGARALAIGFGRAEYQRWITTAQRDRAEENLRLARKLVDDVIRPATEQMADLPFTRDTQREVLKQARDFYERALVQVEDDPEPRRQLAWIYQRLGHLAWCSGSRDGEPALRRSIAILETRRSSRTIRRIVSLDSGRTIGLPFAFIGT